MSSSRSWRHACPSTLRPITTRSNRLHSSRTWALAWRLPQRPERGAHLFREELRFLPSGEVAALVDLVEVDVDVRVGPLDPAAGGAPDLARERGEADRNRDRRRGLADRTGILLCFF